jgi:hypothetical protein
MLAEALSPEIAARPMVYRDDREPVARREQAYSIAEQRCVEDRLRALGYLG